MKYFILPIIITLSIFSTALADTKAELRVNPTGEIHFIGANLLRKHALNLYTIEAWGFKWITNLPYGVKMESLYGASIKPEDSQEGHLLDITGKFILQETGYQIDAINIKDLSINTGTPPPPAPEPIITPTTPIAITKEPKKTSSTPLGEITMLLKNGYRGTQITTLQKFLKKQGLMDKDYIVGVFGNSTEAALKKFQKANNIEATGTVGPKTKTLINSLLEN